MSNTKGRTGRNKLAYLMTEETALVGSSEASPKIEKGKFYYAIAGAETGSAIPVAIFNPFICSKETALAVGDSVIPLTKDLLGFVRDTGDDASKGVQDASTDENDEADSVSDSLVSKIGSISGYYKRGTSSQTAAQKLLLQFDRIAKATASAGSADIVTISEIEHGKVIIMIHYDARECVEGDIVDIDIFPAILTARNSSANTGSVSSLTFNYSKCAQSDEGMKSLHYIGPWHTEVAV